MLVFLKNSFQWSFRQLIFMDEHRFTMIGSLTRTAVADVANFLYVTDLRPTGDLVELMSFSYRLISRWLRRIIRIRKRGRNTYESHFLYLPYDANLGTSLCPIALLKTFYLLYLSFDQIFTISIHFRFLRCFLAIADFCFDLSNNWSFLYESYYRNTNHSDVILSLNLYVRRIFIFKCNSICLKTNIGASSLKNLFKCFFRLFNVRFYFICYLYILSQ